MLLYIDVHAWAIRILNPTAAQSQSLGAFLQNPLALHACWDVGHLWLGILSCFGVLIARGSC
jgi:hypothetical protein